MQTAHRTDRADHFFSQLLDINVICFVEAPHHHLIQIIHLEQAFEMHSTSKHTISELVAIHRARLRAARRESTAGHFTLVSLASAETRSSLDESWLSLLACSPTSREDAIYKLCYITAVVLTTGEPLRSCHMTLLVNSLSTVSE